LREYGKPQERKSFPSFPRVAAARGISILLFFLIKSTVSTNSENPALLSHGAPEQKAHSSGQTGQELVWLAQQRNTAGTGYIL